MNMDEQQQQQQQQGLMPHSATPWKESPITNHIWCDKDWQRHIYQSQAEEQQGTGLSGTRWFSISITNNQEPSNLHVLHFDKEELVELR